MQITTLSAQLDQKLIELEQRLQVLAKQHQQSSDVEEQHKLAADIQALVQIKQKLVKSRDIAWRAHELQREDHTLRKVQRQKWVGLALCAVSAVALVILIIIFVATEL